MSKQIRVIENNKEKGVFNTGIKKVKLDKKIDKNELDKLLTKAENGLQEA